MYKVFPSEVWFNLYDISKFYEYFDISKIINNFENKIAKSYMYLSVYPTEAYRWGQWALLTAQSTSSQQSNSLTIDLVKLAGGTRMS